MLKGIPWALIGSVVVLAFAFSRVHLPKINPLQLGEQTQEGEANAPEAPQSDKTVTFVGPLANYVQQHNPLQRANSSARPYRPHPSDHIAPSPVGTTKAILHKTFSIRATQDFPFEIPAHAVNPQLRGTYQSFSSAAGAVQSDDDADVEFFLLDEPQYQALMGGRPSDALLSADASHSQDVNFNLPASTDRPVKYHLLFRNVARGAPRKIVQADFSIDF